MHRKIFNKVKHTDIKPADIFNWLSKKDRLRIAYAEWLKRECFEYFVVLKFYDGHNICDATAKKQLGYFLRKLDRKFLTRYDNKNGVRLDRMIFVEQGISGENTHFNLYISKPPHVSDFEFRRHLIKFWKQTTGWDDVRTQASDNENDVLFYSTKELDRDLNAELLVVEHCHLSKLHNSDIQKLIYDAMRESVAVKQNEANTKALLERVQRRMRDFSNNTKCNTMGSGINKQASVANELVRLAQPTQDAYT